ncbi:ABC transporter ATP-binding protein [Rosettibacter firmus]|uniref:ABC transporter ATP-binding protein n=1 Tax=Rosettibacter firmus TaxID=3111522 RepID=UPI00336BE607
MSIIQVTNLHKSYETLKAVNGISFSIEKGEMFGLVGPDGAGKTTTIRILCGLIKQDEGVVLLMGKDILKEKKEIQNNIGYLSQKFSLYGDLTVDENIEFFAEIHDVKDYNQRRDELLEFTRLKPFRKRLADQLSGGMKQKLALACSLIHKPQILFLDEPTTGVDPVSRRDFWKILSQLLKEGITILMTTPYLDEAERCNRIALMNKGNIIALDSPIKLKEKINKQVIEIVCNPIRNAYKLLKEKFSLEVQLFGDRINIISDKSFDYEKIIDFLTQNGIEIIDKRITTPSLENIFMHLIK